MSVLLGCINHVKKPSGSFFSSSTLIVSPVSVPKHYKWKFSLNDLILRYGISCVVHLVVSHTE